MDILLAPLKLFAFNPVAAFVVAAVFALCSFLRVYARRARIILGIAAAVWGLYGVWESYISSWRSPSGDMAIRVDLVLFGPLLLAVGISGFVIIVSGRKRRMQEEEEGDNTAMKDTNE
jgi:hypothetical protein